MAGSTIRLDFDTDSTKTLFSDSGYDALFTVKPPQRRYKWRKEQVEQFWNDIIRALEGKQESYFLGTLLLQPLGEKRYSIIDGQQRLATLALLIALLRDECRAVGRAPRAGNLHKLIVRLNEDNEPIGPLVITLQQSDDQLFQHFVKLEESTSNSLPPDRPKTERMYVALTTLRQHLDAFLSRQADREKAITQLADYVTDKVKMLPLEIASEAQAYLVFDTTNTRGLPLSPAEALKARLAVIVRDDPALAESFISKWNLAAHALEQAQLSVNAMDNYLLVIWSSRRGYTTIRKLASAVVAVLDQDKESPKQIAADIEKYIHSYIAVVNPTGTSQLSEDLRDLRRLRLTQANGFLTMVHRHEGTLFSRAVQATLALQVRNITIGDQQANAFQKLWPKWSNLARNNRTGEALKEIGDRLESDERFKYSFITKSIRESGASRHILRRLDLAEAPLSGLLPVDVDVEHVLPQSVVNKLVQKKRLTRNVQQWITDLGFPIPSSDEEKRQLGEKIEPYLFRIGNQALVHKTPNRAGKDKPFQDKRKGYQDMSLKLTNLVGNKAEWDFSSIDKRQEYLADLAVKAWSKG